MILSRIRSSSATGCCAALLAFSGCSADRAPLPPETVLVTVTAEPVETVDPTLGGSLADALHAAGVSDGAVHALAVVGQASGYLWRSRAFTQEEAQTFAYVAVNECREITRGEKSWDDLVEEALADGTARTDAVRVMTHLRTSFCPKVDGGGQ